jgi:hypothetical protein
LSRFTISIELESTSVNHAIRRIVSELVVVHIGTVVLHNERNDQNDLDPHTRSVDRSISRERHSPEWRTSENMLRGRQSAPDKLMPGEFPTRIVHQEMNFFFVGSEKREVVFSTPAHSMEDAWQRFHSSKKSTTSIMFVIKTETEIYLAQ